MENKSGKIIKNLERRERLILGEKTFVNEIIFLEVDFETVDFTGSTFVTCTFKNCRFKNVIFGNKI